MRVPVEGNLADEAREAPARRPTGTPVSRGALTSRTPPRLTALTRGFGAALMTTIVVASCESPGTSPDATDATLGDARDPGDGGRPGDAGSAEVGGSLPDASHVACPLRPAPGDGGGCLSTESDLDITRCDWPVTSELFPSNSAPCASTILIVESRSGGGRQHPAPWVYTKDSCGSAPGWYFDDANEPETIVLCPESCITKAGIGAQKVTLRPACP